MKVIISIVFLILLSQEIVKTQTVNFTTAEKSRIIQILLKTFEQRFRKEKKIQILIELTPKEIIGLLPKRFSNKRVVLISDKEAFRLRKLNLFYYDIYPIIYKEGAFIVSISRVGACYSQYNYYKFFKQNGKIKKEKVEAGISRCGPDEGLKREENPIKKAIIEDDDPPPPMLKPPVKIIKPNE